MYCRQCGKEIQEDSKFCAHCGCCQDASESLSDYTEENEDLIRCPKCNSTQLTSNKKGFSAGKAAAGAFLAGGIGLLAGGIGSKKIYVTCLKCGHSWVVNDKNKDSSQSKGCGCLALLFLLIIFFIVVSNSGSSGETDTTTSSTASTVTNSAAVSTTIPKTESTTEPLVTLKSEAMIKAFRDNEVNFDMQYDGKYIVVIGTVYEVDNESHIFSDDEQIVRLKTNDIYSLSCHMLETQKDTVASLNKGDKVKIKGRCFVYDDFVSIYDAEILG